MKTKLFLVIAFFSMQSYAQISKIEGINKFKLRNSGVILDKNKDADGYYFFYVVDKLKKGNSEFAIQILDKNLNEVAKKTYVENKNTFLMSSSFNNQALMFAMANFVQEKIELLSFDKQANQQKTVSIPLEKKEIRYLQMAMEQTSEFNVLFPVENKGFIFNKFEDNKKIGYSLKYYPTDGGKAWEYSSPDESKEILAINPIEVNDKILVAIETSRPSLLSRKVTIRTKIIDVVTGKLIFEVENTRDVKPRLINNAFVNSDGSIVLVGEYFKDGDNVFTDKSLGLYAQVLDDKGITIKESFISWSEDVTKIVKTTKSFLDDKGYVYFHKMLQTKNGEYYAIGEYFKKTVSGAGVAMKILSRGQAAATQISIGNAVIFKFDNDFKLKSIKEFDKTKSNVPCITDFGSPQLNAHVVKAFGGFDYEYTQIDKTNDRFYACFVDYEKEKGQKSKNAFKTIIYDDGELSQDKIYLKDGEKEFKVLPGKLGNVMLVEYNKKEKSINIHLEKINIK